MERGRFDFRRHAWFLGLGDIRARPFLVKSSRSSVCCVAKATFGVHAIIFAGKYGRFCSRYYDRSRVWSAKTTYHKLKTHELGLLVGDFWFEYGIAFFSCILGFKATGCCSPPMTPSDCTPKHGQPLARFLSRVFTLGCQGEMWQPVAFVMISVMLVALIFDRMALSLRP